MSPARRSGAEYTYPSTRAPLSLCPHYVHDLSDHHELEPGSRRAPQFSRLPPDVLFASREAANAFCSLAVERETASEDDSFLPTP